MEQDLGGAYTSYCKQVIARCLYFPKDITGITAVDAPPKFSKPGVKDLPSSRNSHRDLFLASNKH